MIDQIGVLALDPNDDAPSPDQTACGVQPGDHLPGKMTQDFFVFVQKRLTFRGVADHRVGLGVEFHVGRKPCAAGTHHARAGNLFLSNHLRKF